MREIFVFVYLPRSSAAVPAGVLTYDEQARVGQFSYGRRYRDRRDSLPVDPIALPLAYEDAPGTTMNGGLYGAIRDAAPDYWGRLVTATTKQINIAQLNEADLLLTPNALRVGRLDFRASLDAPELPLGPPHLQKLPELLEAAAAIEARQPVRADLLPLLEQGTTLGGSRPKCTVVKDEELWVAKFPARNDAYNNARVEFATMRLAQLAGVRIPEVEVHAIGGRDVLLVRRFDRKSVAGGYARYGFMSALSLAQWDETDRHLFSYPAIAEQMRLIGCSRGDIAEFYTRMVFNICCRNTDDHPRNHAFVAEREQYALSLAYDVTPTAASLNVGQEFNLSMHIGNSGRLASLDNARSSHGVFGLTLQQADEMIGRVKSMTSRWREHFRACGVTDPDIETFAGSFENPLISTDLPNASVFAP
jgi:serine/threonine-protein kinase HipA